MEANDACLLGWRGANRFRCGALGPPVLRLPRLLALVALLAAVAALPSVVAQGNGGPVEVHVTVAVTSFGNYDAKQGTYVLDFYLVLEWDPATAPDNFTAAEFEFANGRATSRELQLDEVNATTGMRTLWYRIQANLYSEPRYDAYPFDKQRVEIRIEDKAQPERLLRYVAKSGAIEERFQPAGWQVVGTNFTVERSQYSFDEPYSQAHFEVVLQRSVLSGVLKVILPPLAFIIISGVSFFLVGADKVATRFGLAANMAISGVMFHAAQSASLPSLSRLIFLDRYMLAIDIFLFASVFVTALVALAEMKWKSPAKAKRINLRGAIIVPALAVAAFLLMLLV